MKPPARAKIRTHFLPVVLFVMMLTCCGLSEPRMAPGAPDGFIEVDSTRFVFRDSSSHAPFVPVGVNYDHDSSFRLIEDYWGGEWPRVEDDFAEIASLGFNTVRIHLQFCKFMAGPEAVNPEAFERLDRLIALARGLGLRLDVTGLAHYRKSDIPAWFLGLDDDAMIRAEAFFWEKTAERYKNETAIFCYDLQNEPALAFADGHEIVGRAFEDGFHYVNIKGRSISPRWTQWVQKKYRTEDALREKWADFPRSGEGFDKVGFPGMLDKERNRDYLQFAHEQAARWTRLMTDAIRKSDKRHLVTVGLTSWSLPFEDVYSAFSPLHISPWIDFISLHVHITGSIEANNWLESEMALRAAHIGKPVLIEEISFLAPEIVREQFLKFAHESASGFLGYYWGRTVEELRADGSMQSSIIADSIERLSKLAGEWKSSPPKYRAGDAAVSAPVIFLRLSAEARKDFKEAYAALKKGDKRVDVRLAP